MTGALLNAKDIDINLQDWIGKYLFYISRILQIQMKQFVRKQD